MRYEPEITDDAPEEGGETPIEELGLLEACLGVITEPVTTLAGIVQRRPLGWAFIVIVALGVIGGIAQAAVDMTAEESAAAATLGIGNVVAFPVGWIVGTAFFAGCLWISSRILSGRAGYQALFVGVAFAGVPGVISSALILLGVLGPGLQVIGGLLSLAILVWTLVLDVIVIRQANGFSTGRAIGALAIGLGVPIGIIVIAVVLIVVAFAIAAGAE